MRNTRRLSVAAAAPPQIADQGFADVTWQGQPVALVAFAVDLALPGAPVQVVELKAGDLDRAQAEPCEQHQDRDITRAHQARSITGPEQPLDLADRGTSGMPASRQRATDGTERASPGSVSPRRPRKRSSKRSRLA